MAFLDGITDDLGGIGKSFGLSGNASKNAFLGSLFGPGNAVTGAMAGPIANYFTGADAANASKAAQREANRTKRRSLVRQMGEREQADSFALSALRQNNKPADGGGLGPNSPGFIGSGLSTSGTF